MKFLAINLVLYNIIMEWKLLLPSYNDNNKTKQNNIPTVKI